MNPTLHKRNISAPILRRPSRVPLSGVGPIPELTPPNSTRLANLPSPLDDDEDADGKVFQISNEQVIQSHHHQQMELMQTLLRSVCIYPIVTRDRNLAKLSRIFSAAIRCALD